MTIKDIVSKVKLLNLPKGSYIVYGSCPMTALKIREAKDIDLYVSQEIYDDLKKKGWKEVYKGPKDKPVVYEDIEAHNTWDFSAYNPTIEELLSRSFEVEGIDFASLEDVRKWKASSGRPKDLDDIKLINDNILMNKKQPTPLKIFEFEGTSLPVRFVETQDVVEGVVCDVYTFEGDSSKDLAIIRVQPGFKTPLQRVLQGEKTIEGYVSGKGKLNITRSNNEKESFEVNENLKKPLSVTVMVGDLMQWHADKDSNLVAYEVCFPPYKDGRFENIE